MFTHKLKVVLLINDTETCVETCVSFKLSKLLNKEHVEVFTNGIPANPNLHPVPTQEHAKAQLCDAERKKSKLYANIKRHAKQTY